MFNKIIFVVSLFLFIHVPANCYDDEKETVTDDPDPEICERMLESFAYVSGNFTYCAIQNARPIRLCINCITDYLNVRSVYHDINNIDPTSGEFCKDKLFNLDRLQIVDSGFKYVANLWQRASCDSCFILDGSHCPTPNLKPEVNEFLNISGEYQICVKNHRNDSLVNLYDPEVCTSCKNLYKALNAKYIDLKGPDEFPLCMDIVDMMNLTRTEWSTTLGCYVMKKKAEVVYLLITGLVGVIPFFFYFCAWGLITKKEQIIKLQNNFPGYLRQVSWVRSQSIDPR